MQQQTIYIETHRRGLYLITDQVKAAFSELPKTGLLNCFVHHTSASLIIQENADPSAQTDLETFINKLAADSEPWHKHTHEGKDDTTSHMKSALTSTSLNIPVIDGRIGLGTWQGVFLWEHRLAPHRRKITLTVF